MQRSHAIHAVTGNVPAPATPLWTPCADFSESEGVGAKSIFIVFGGFGDLARRKIFPALNALEAKGGVPDGFHVLAVGRRGAGGSEATLRGVVSEHLAKRLGTIKIDYNDEGFAELKRHCLALAGAERMPNLLFHLAVPPSAFGDIASGLQRAGLVHPSGGPAWSRLLLEKPFGVDVKTAEGLNRALLGSFAEDQIYRIDHYLGKPSVHLPFLLRILLPELEGLWNARHVACVALKSKETLGCENRAAYFDGVGILKDMVQSHLLQILALVAMEIPHSFTARAFCEEKIRALRQVRPIRPEPTASEKSGALRGQYHGYRGEDGVAQGSCTETYAALKLELGGARWEGVPFFLEAGKRMDRKETHLEIRFREPGAPLGGPRLTEVPRRILIRMQPEADAIAEFSDGREVTLESEAIFHPEFGIRGKKTVDQDGYSVLIEQALQGKSRLFLHAEEIDLAWRCLEPVIKNWSLGTHGIIEYPCGWEGGIDQLAR